MSPTPITRVTLQYVGEPFSSPHPSRVVGLSPVLFEPKQRASPPQDLPRARALRVSVTTGAHYEIER